MTYLIGSLFSQKKGSISKWFISPWRKFLINSQEGACWKKLVNLFFPKLCFHCIYHDNVHMWNELTFASQSFTTCGDNIHLANFFLFISTMSKQKHLQFVILQRPDSLIRWSVISENFRKIVWSNWESGRLWPMTDYNFDDCLLIFVSSYA